MPRLAHTAASRASSTLHAQCAAVMPLPEVWGVVCAAAEDEMPPAAAAAAAGDSSVRPLALARTLSSTVRPQMAALMMRRALNASRASPSFTIHGASIRQPNCWAQAVGSFVLALEDLSHGHRELAPVPEGGTAEAEALLRSTAALHAAFWGRSEGESKRLIVGSSWSQFTSEGQRFDTHCDSITSRVDCSTGSPAGLQRPARRLPGLVREVSCRQSAGPSCHRPA
jgi:hypothetical protein